MVYYSAVPFSHWYSSLFDTLTQKSNSGLLYFVFLYSVFFQVYYFFKWHIIQQPRKTLRLASASQFLKSLCLGNPPSLARFANLFYILFFHVYYFFKWFIIQQPRFIFYSFQVYYFFKWFIIQLPRLSFIYVFLIIIYLVVLRVVVCVSRC